MRTRKNRGFTLMELLIVIAIIAVLVAVAIPVLSSQLEKSREAADLANIRNAYAEIMVKVMTEEDVSQGYSWELKQTVSGWDTESAQSSLVGITADHVVGAPVDGTNTVLVEWLEDEQAVRVTFNGGSGGSGDDHGGSGDTPSSFHPSPNLDTADIQNGTVLQSTDGRTYVIPVGATPWEMTNYYRNNGADAFIANYASSLVEIDPNNVKDANSSDLATGDVCYDSETGDYYYIRSYNQYDTSRGQWTLLIQ